MEPIVWIVVGAVLGGVFTLVGGPATRRRGVAVYGVGLAVAAAVYLVLALVGDAAPGDLLKEVAGLVLFGALAAVGVARDPWLIGAGWLLHALWDGMVHPHGLVTHAPEAYRWLCIGFDVVVGGKFLLDLRRDS